MLQFSRALAWSSLIKYVIWKTAGHSPEITLQLRSGIKFILRAQNNINNDYGVAYEVLILDYYRLSDPIDRDKVRCIVDLGGNVGISVLHWMNVFPACTIETFEPHPLHVAQMRRNLALSGKQHRVVVHDKAAGARRRAMRLTDDGTSSSLQDQRRDGFDVEVADVFDVLSGRRIDILKMDIEGGEYEILEDPRFDRLDIGRVVMEWHSRGHGDADRQWCEQRLTTLGYAIRPVFQAPDHGMFWAIRDTAASPRDR